MTLLFIEYYHHFRNDLACTFFNVVTGNYAEEGYFKEKGKVELHLLRFCEQSPLSLKKTALEEGVFCRMKKKYVQLRVFSLFQLYSCTKVILIKNNNLFN